MNSTVTSESKKHKAPFAKWATKKAHALFFYHKNILNNCYAGHEVFYTKKDSFKKYENSKLLIIGGGPSTNEVDFNYEKYDYIWSTNHFFLNKKLRDIKIDMAMMRGEPDVSSPELIKYIDKFDTMIGVELHHRWSKEVLENHDYYFIMHTNLYSKLGACPGMIIFAGLLGARKIDFIGLDGPAYIKRREHAFQPGKSRIPGAYSGKGGNQIYKSDCKIFWNYISLHFPNTKFKNLGYGQEFHVGL